MKFTGKRVSIYKTHRQEATEKEYEGKIIAFNENSELVFTVMQDNGTVTVPFPTLCRVHLDD